jgi:hypothetical protein
MATTPMPGPRWRFGYDFIEAWSVPRWQPKRTLMHLLRGCTSARASDETGSWDECTQCRHATNFSHARGATPSGSRHER